MRKTIILIVLACILFIMISPTYPSVNNLKSQEKDREIETFIDYDIEITTPVEGNFYALGAQFFRLPFNWTVLVGPITIRTEVSEQADYEVKFYIDDVFQVSDLIYPYEYPWWTVTFGRHTLKVELYSEDILRDTDTVEVFKIL